jgi:hypothetical protein
LKNKINEKKIKKIAIKNKDQNWIQN